MIQKSSIPNTLTVCRLVLTIIIAGLFLFAENYFIIYTLFLLAAFSDFADGHLARCWNAVSAFGKIFDPLADKLLILTLIMFIYSRGIIWPAILLILVIRDIAIEVSRWLSVFCSVIVPAHQLAQWKTAMQLLMLNFALLYLSFPELVYLKIFANIFATTALIFSLWSGAIYMSMFAYTFVRRIKQLREFSS